MTKLVLGTGLGFPEVPVTEQIKKIKKAGWDGVFVGLWKEDLSLREFAEAAKAEGLFIQSVHAPFNKAATLWDEGEAGDFEVERQIRVLRETAEIGVDLVIMHAIIGMANNTPTALGVERYRKIAEAACALGVRIAIENTEGEVYLEALMEGLRDFKNVGFCIDTGHEMCYNGGKDLITQYGDRLIATHLNDNTGQTGEMLTWHDDSHLLPFDGKADWDGISKRLKNTGFRGPLTFELTSKNTPERHVSDIYADLDFDGFVSLALERARKFRELFEHI